MKVEEFDYTIEGVAAKNMKKGLQEGIERGIEKGMGLVAQNMLRENMNIALISKMTGLSQNYILTLKKERI